MDSDRGPVAIGLAIACLAASSSLNAAPPTKPSLRYLEQLAERRWQLHGLSGWPNLEGLKRLKADFQGLDERIDRWVKQHAPTPRCRTCDVFNLPAEIHRRLDAAGELEVQGRLRQALVSYDQIPRQWGGAVVLEALHRSQRLRLRLGAKKSMLVDTALERAEVLDRESRLEAAQLAYLDAIRFGLSPALLSSFPRVDASDEVWAEQGWIETGPCSEPARGRCWHRFDPVLGFWTAEGRLSSTEKIIASARGDLVWLEGQILSRRGEEGRRWRVRVPRSFRAVEAIGQGHLLAYGPAGFQWIDAATGRTGVRGSARVLATAEEGAVVRVDEAAQMIGFSRPGQGGPVWTSSIGSGWRSAMVGPSRLAVVDDRAMLRLYDLATGIQTGAVHGVSSVMSMGVRFALAHRSAPDAKSRSLSLIDVLAGGEINRLVGPGQPVAGHIGDRSLSVLYRTGDILHYDFDGLVIDRAWVNCTENCRIRQGRARHRFAVTSAQWVWFLSSPGPGPTESEILLRAASVAERNQQPGTALRIATEVAQTSAGAIGPAERMRARLLRDRAPSLAKACLIRARAADVPSQPLPAFQN